MDNKLNVENHLSEVSQWGGKHFLIDTDEEKQAAAYYLRSKISECGETDIEDEETINNILKYAKALHCILDNPDHSFAINFFSNHNGNLCSSILRDCDALLIPVEAGLQGAVAVFSGGSFGTFTDYLSITEEEWQNIILPLSTPADSAAEEKENLRTVVDNFEAFVSSDDVSGWLGNLLPSRGQQDCVQDAKTLFSLLYMLSSESLLKFHEFDPIDGFAMVPGLHYALNIHAPDGGKYVVDGWGDETVIEGFHYWETYYNNQLKALTASPYDTDFLGM